MKGFLSVLPGLIYAQPKAVQRGLLMWLDFVIATEAAARSPRLGEMIRKAIRPVSWRRNMSHVIMEIASIFSDDPDIKGIIYRVLYFCGPVSTKTHEIKTTKRKQLRVPCTYFKVSEFEDRAEALV